VTGFAGAFDAQLPQRVRGASIGQPHSSQKFTGVVSASNPSLEHKSPNTHPATNV
jgi:hypothetical protein